MSALPPIEKWWPGLPAQLKQEVLADPTAALSQEVIDAARPGTPSDFVDGVDEGYDIIKLTPEERDFVKTQAEPVD